MKIKTTSVIGGVAALMLASMNLAQAAAFDCLIKPNQTLEIRSQNEGLIEQVLVKRGDQVSQGQPLVILDRGVEQSTVNIARHRAETRAEIQAAQARLDYASSKLARSDRLAKNNFVSVQTREEIEAEKRIARAELSEAKASKRLAELEYQRALQQLQRTTITSPIDGMVLNRSLNPGEISQISSGGKSILTLVKVYPLIIDVTLPQSAYRKLSTGASGKVKPEGFIGEYLASVTVIDPILDAASGTFTARMELEQGEGKDLPAGLRCQVEFSEL